MNPTQPAPTESKKSASVAVAHASDRRQESVAAMKPRGYGLPCAQCKTYYAADLDECPVCHAKARIKPPASAISASASAASHEPLGETPDPDLLEQERERFLREFKSQVYASHAQINVAESFRCSREENHPGEFEPAEVCGACYERVQGRVDVMEAALHMELKEATQIIYDAVWADTSDTSKTYENAAQALLTEIRKRAGIPAVLGTHQPLPH